ncbi:MAG: class I tRNA ligase family protein, partial [Candidatus Micrarchaeota archaeon]
MLGKLDHKAIQKKWVAEWEKKKVYEFDYSKGGPYYVLDTPPPFPTGEFHTGHVLNWAYMDFVARYKRMKGFNVSFPQGWDCHGFPTEVKVEQKYGRLPREEFLKRCLEWSHNVISTMKPQMKELGLSIDWSQEYITLDKEYYRKVQLSLLQMFEKGL